MNMMLMLMIALVAFAYYGGASCPKMLKDNKEMLLGVIVGLFVGKHFSMKIEGMMGFDEMEEEIINSLP